MGKKLFRELNKIKSIDDYYKFKSKHLLIDVLEEVWEQPDTMKDIFFEETMRLMNVLKAYHAKNEIFYLYKNILEFLALNLGYKYYSKLALLYVPILLENKILKSAEKILNYLIFNKDKINKTQETVRAYYLKLLLFIEYAKMKSLAKDMKISDLHYKSNWLEMNYEYKIYNIEILAKNLKNLNLDKQQEKEVINQLKSILLYFRIQDFDSAYQHINNLADFLKSIEEDKNDFNLLVKILQVEAAIQSSDFISLNSYFTVIVEYFDTNNYLKDEIAFLIYWSYHFFENGMSEESKNALLKIKEFCHDDATVLYAKLIYKLFRIAIQENEEVYSTYLELLIGKYEPYLDLTEKHFVRLIAAEDSSLDVNKFEDSIENFKKSNQYLMKNWNQVIYNVNTSLHDIKDIDPSLINKAIERNFKEILLDSNLHINHFLQSLENVFDNLRRMYQNVQEQSLTDQLTQLHNRRYLMSNAPEMFFLAMRQGIPISVAMFDLDDFKKLNDTYGHHIGDKVLQGFAGILKKSFRQSDIIVRYGGEEFIAVLFDANLEEGRTILEKVRKRFAEKTFYSENAEELHATVSIGVTSDYIYGDRTNDILERLINNADIALYQSKNNGKNRISLFLQ